MGEVDVHRHDDVVAVVEGVLETGPVGAAEALLARPAQHRDLPQLGAELGDHVASAVRAVVVDDEHVGIGDRLPAPRGAASRTLSRSLYVGTTTSTRMAWRG